MQNKTPMQIQRSLNVVFSFFFLSVIVVLLISSFVVKQYGPLMDLTESSIDILRYVAIFSLVIHLPLAFYLPQKAIRKIDNNIPLKNKMYFYYKALFLRFAIITSALIIICLFFVFTADTNIIYIAAMGLIFFLISKPNPFKTATDLKLKGEEKNQLFESK